jgi:regulator of RNase E activity RraA
MLDTSTIAALKTCSAATLTTQLFKRGLRNVFMQGVRPLTRIKTPMIGEAFTVRYIPAREDIDHVGVFADPEHPQRKAIETVPPGQVLVSDCRRDARAASGGSILLTRLKVRGAAGFVSDGGLRDSPEIAGFDLPVYCGGPAAPLNLVLHHAVDLNVPVGCGGVPVYPGDVVFGDGEGVVVIPKHLASEVAADAAEQELLEAFVLEEVQKGAPVIGTYPPSPAVKAKYEAWRAKKAK